MCEALPHRGYFTQSSALHIREFAVGICRENLPREFAARICRGYLPQEFAVGILSQEFTVAICRRNLSWLYESKPFLHVSKTFY